ncbi:MAG: hypothetical protein ACRDLQ_06890 [Solirubrobacterales bacterium]
MDVEDFEALAEELGGDAVAVGLGDGRDRAARVSWSRPDLIRVVVGCDASPMGRFVGDVEAPSASQAVLEAVVGLADSNHRAAMRGILEFTNPGMTEDELRRRLDAEVAYSSLEAIRARSQWFLRKDSVEAARAIRHFPDHVGRQVRAADGTGGYRMNVCLGSGSEGLRGEVSTGRSRSWRGVYFRAGPGRTPGKGVYWADEGGPR